MTITMRGSFVIGSVSPLTDGYPGLPLHFTGLYALVPCVLISGTVSTSAVFEPGTTTTTATSFTRFCDGAAFRAYPPGSRRRSFWSRGMRTTVKSRAKNKHENIHKYHGLLLLLQVNLSLTFACIYARKPRVIYVLIFCSTPAVLVPSTTRSATTKPAGFCKHPALWTRHCTKTC